MGGSVNSNGKITLGERILLVLSRKPGSSDYKQGGQDRKSIATSLKLLRRVFPGFDETIKGKRVLDHGCGEGWQCVGMIHAGADYAVGLESNEKTLSAAREVITGEGLAGKVEFFSSLPPALENSFDIVISQNCFEHYPDPEKALTEMRVALKEGGRLYITFGPPWFAPYGSHMHFFTRVPWVNILFSECTVMNVRGRFRNDGAKRYVEVESGLNKMSLEKFKHGLQQAGLATTRTNYECFKGLDFLGRIPVLNELSVIRVNCEAVVAADSTLRQYRR